ncbi:MAG: DNA repair protein RadC, partial [Candidatus Erginobacter occultus]|nr:DNA repair protein RadC [Candidatus Erginobacter occultus]
MANRKQADGSGHRRRLRERFARSGLKGFHDHEIVELLLALGTPRKDTKGPARAALAKFGSLKDVLDAPPGRLTEVPGVGPKNIIALRLVKEVAARYLKDRLRERPLAGSPRAVFDYLRQDLGGLHREVFSAVFLNTANKIIEVEQVAEGTVNRAAIHPREVIAAALKHNASRVIFAHNHPAGSMRPSDDDIEITTRLKKA